MICYCPRCGKPKSAAAKTCRACYNSREYNTRYLRWRKAVLETDHYTCQACLLEDPTGRSLETHHIRGYRQNPELRYAVKNGIALCKNHHAQFHRIYGSFNNTWYQMWEYLEGKALNRCIEAEKAKILAEGP